MQTVVCLFLSVIVGFYGTQGQVISQPDDFTVCEGEEAVFTCGFNTTNNNINSDDVQWYRLVKDTGITEMVDQQDNNNHFTTSTINNTLTSQLTITNVNESHTGYYWVGMPWFNVCNVSLTLLTSPPALTVNIMKKIESLSIVVQWDLVDDSFATTYTLTWSSKSGHDLEVVALKLQTSYTLTNLTLGTVYSITITASNRCGDGPEFATRIVFIEDTTSTTSSISATVTTSTNPMSIISTASSVSITISPTVTTSTNPMTIISTASSVSITISPTVTTSTNPMTIISTASSVSITISPTVTTSTNPMTIMSTANPITTTTTTTTTTATVTTPRTTTTMVPSTTIISSPATTTSSTTIMTPSTTTTTTTAVTSYSTTIVTTAVHPPSIATASALEHSSATTTISVISSSTVATATSVTNPSATATNTVIKSPNTPTMHTTTVSTSPATTATTLDDSTDATNDSDDGSSGSMGVIVGGVVGGFIILSGFLIVFYLLCVRKRKKDKADRVVHKRKTPATNGIPSVTNPVAIPKAIPDTEQNQEKCRSSVSNKQRHKKHFSTNKDSTPEPEDADNESVENLEVQKPEYHELLHIQKRLKTRQGDSGASPDDYYSTPRPSASNDVKPVQNHEEQYSTPRASVNDGFNPAQEDRYSTPRPSVNNDSSVVQNNMDCYSTQRPSVNNGSSSDQNHEDCYAALRPSANINSASHQNHEDRYFAVPSHQNHENGYFSVLPNEKNDIAPSRTVAVTEDECDIRGQTMYDNLPEYATTTLKANHNTSINQTTAYDHLYIPLTVIKEFEESPHGIASINANSNSKDKIDNVNSSPPTPGNANLYKIDPATGHKIPNQTTA